MCECIPAEIKEVLLQNVVKPNTSSGFTSLSKAEHKLAVNLLDRIEQLSLFTFRGINTENTLDSFVFSEPLQRSIEHCAKLIFYFGEKAKACVEERLRFFPGLNTITLSQLIHLAVTTSLALNKIDPHTFFAAENREFFDFFCDSEVEANLTALYKHFSNDSDAKLKLRNMLISFLHTEHANEYKLESALVSTTPKYDEAEMFAGSDGLILLCWVPHPKDKYVITASPAAEYYECLDKYGVPTLTTGLHVYEGEISFIGAIFPHFIYGFYDVRQGVTVLNPHQFTHHRKVDSCVINGIYIDQSKFKTEMKKKTYFHRYAELAIGAKSGDIILLSSAEGA